MIFSHKIRWKKSPNPIDFYQIRTFNARSGVRTLDTLIKSQVLCQLS